MNTIFKYSVHAKYSTKDLKGGYNSNIFSLLNAYLNEKEPSVKNQLPNKSVTFKAPIAVSVMVMA